MDCCNKMTDLGSLEVAFDVLGVITSSGGLPGTVFANPTASVGLTAVNGTATTAMRSDAAPPLDQGIAPTWTSEHTFQSGMILSPYLATPGDYVGQGFTIYSDNHDGPLGAVNPCFVFDHTDNTASQATGNLVSFRKVNTPVAAIKQDGVLMGFGLGIGLGTSVTTQPGAKAEIRFSSEQLRLSSGVNNYCSFTVDGSANTTIDCTASAGTPEVTFPDPVNFTAAEPSITTEGIDLGSTTGRIDSNVANADETANVLLQPTTTLSNSDTRYLMKLNTSGGTSRFQFTTNGDVYCNLGGFFSGGVSKTVMPLNGNYFSKSFSGTLTANSYSGAVMQASVRHNDGSGVSNFVGFSCNASWLAAGTYTGNVTVLRGGQFQCFTQHASGSVSNLQGGYFTAGATGAHAGAHTVTVVDCGSYLLQLTGTDCAISNATGININTPTGPGTNTTVTNYYGLIIQDQLGIGSSVHQALRINAQTNGTGAKGNIHCDGGDWNNGHLQLNTGHVWATSGDIRFKDGTPTGATDYDVAITSTEIEINGNLNHDGSNIGFFGKAPATQAAAYTPTNVSTDRSFDANATSIDELADVLGTLISDLQSYGLLQ